MMAGPNPDSLSLLLDLAVGLVVFALFDEPLDSDEVLREVLLGLDACSGVLVQIEVNFCVL